jgi:hypothetical protein
MGLDRFALAFGLDGRALLTVVQKNWHCLYNGLAGITRINFGSYDLAWGCDAGLPNENPLLLLRLCNLSTAQLIRQTIPAASKKEPWNGDGCQLVNPIRCACRQAC